MGRKSKTPHLDIVNESEWLGSFAPPTDWREKAEAALGHPLNRDDSALLRLKLRLYATGEQKTEPTFAAVRKKLTKIQKLTEALSHELGSGQEATIRAFERMEEAIPHIWEHQSVDSQKIFFHYLDDLFQGASEALKLMETTPKGSTRKQETDFILFLARLFESYGAKKNRCGRFIETICKMLPNPPSLPEGERSLDRLINNHR